MTEFRTIDPDRVLRGHTSEETAYLVDDYPYGFRLRCSIRYWIETNPKHGDRLVSQTLNPKTDRWNKPKRSTYSPVGVMYLDSDEHVTWTAMGTYSEPDHVAYILGLLGDDASNAQKAQAAWILAAHKVMQNVTTTIHEGAFTDEERAEQDATLAAIGRAVNHEAHGIRPTLDNPQPNN